MKHWTKDKRWADRFMPEIQGIIGRELVQVAPAEEDMFRNTDLQILSSGQLRIGVRMRRYQYLLGYADEFTIRAVRERNETELGKIVTGFGDYFFYGFSDEEEKRVQRWMLGDLNAFRYWFGAAIMCGYKRHCRGQEVMAAPWCDERKNKDGSSDFYAFNAEKIPGFIYASNWDDPSSLPHRQTQDNRAEFELCPSST